VRRRSPDFAERDVYVCPSGKELHFDRPHSRCATTTLSSTRQGLQSLHTSSAQCTTSKQGRSLCRSVDEACLKRVRAYQATAAYKKALRKRQVWVEPLFAEGKDWHGMRRFRLRRPWRVNCEALMIASGLASQTAAQKAGMGTAAMPSRSRFYPLFDLVVVVDSFFVVVCLYFHEYAFTFTSEQAPIHSIFLMSFARGFFNSLFYCANLIRL
jgi:Transposase DDE domain